MKPSLFKNWEYWPSFMFYIPLLPYAFYLAFKHRTYGYFSAVNPVIEESGNGLESKFSTLELIPENLKPKSILIKANSKINNVIELIEASEIDYPLIIKPDIGYRGLLVKKIDSPKDLNTYLEKYGSIQLIVQSLISLPNECGIFYYKIPGEQTGRVSSITLKKFLSVTGNGIATLRSLITADKRASRYLEILKKLHKSNLDHIPKKDEEVLLTIIGNHSKGTQFFNGNHLISRELEHSIDKLQSHIGEWFYGRLDLKYNRFEDILNGENFKIIELNGIISEPTHIYDASQGTYFKALKAIKNHWKIAAAIGQKNKNLGRAEFTDFKFLINLYFRHKAYAKKVRKLC